MRYQIKVGTKNVSITKLDMNNEMKHIFMFAIKS